jgi:hypothetical protein
MEYFENVLGVVMACVIGIIVLTVFFKLLAALQRHFDNSPLIKVTGLTKPGGWVNVHVAGGKAIERVKFVGFTEQGGKGGNLPYQMATMLVLEQEDGRRIFVRADSVRMLEEVT